jgi:HD-like signal output (HDOD) protein
MNVTIESLISGIPSLGSYSPVLKEIEDVISDPQCTLADVGEVIEKDTDLTARLLRLGNSSYFGFPNRIETISETITLIGVQQVQDLIFASKIVDSFKGIPADMVNMASFWKHSMACGVAARILAVESNAPKPEKFFIVGLLHDVGRLVLYSRAPERARKVFECYLKGRMLLREAEAKILDFDHTDIGEAFLRAWDYPANLVNAIRFHHRPLSAGLFQLEASVVHVADYVVNAMELGSSGEHFVPPLNSKAWERLNLPVDFIEVLMDRIDEQVSSVEDALSPVKVSSTAP